MSITEKELAEGLEESAEFRADHPKDWVHVARRAAELLGVELAPEKPAPGTWHHTENASPARVHWDGWLHVFYSDGEYDIHAPDADWPALTPARVVSESQWQTLRSHKDDMVQEVRGWTKRALAAEAKVQELELQELEARVAPAAPVELSDIDMRHAFDQSNSGFYWTNFSGGQQNAFLIVANILLARRGEQK